MTNKSILFEDHGPYATVTLNRPEQRNALDRAAQLELQQVFRQSVGRFSAIILTGAGSSFCAGLDEAEAPEVDHSRQGNIWVDTIEAIRKHPSVIIAAVNGEALGDGVSLINTCDLAIAAEDAQIGLPDITRSAYPETAGPSTQLRILRKHASWLILTGRSIDGRTAAKWGLVNLAVPAGQVIAQARAAAGDIAKFNPVTVDWTKKALDDIPAHISDWTAALEYGRAVTAVVQNRIGKDKVMWRKS